VKTTLDDGTVVTYVRHATNRIVERKVTKPGDPDQVTRFAYAGVAHLALGVVVSVAVGAAAVAVCAGTVGIGCPLAAGVAIGLLVGVLPHFALDPAVEHKTTAIEAVSYVAAPVRSTVITNFITKPVVAAIGPTLRSALTSRTAKAAAGTTVLAFMTGSAAAPKAPATQHNLRWRLRYT
jgi:hypothetical protein